MGFMRIGLSLLPALPLLSALLLGMAGRRMPDALVAIVACASVGGAALVTGALAFGMDGPVVVALWNWIEVEGFVARAVLRLDALSLLMCIVITGVGFLIHVYSSEYMQGEEGYARYFAWLNLFVAAMLVLVLADDLLFLLLGWEGVGLCSYLLIGFWYRDPAFGYAARKAFVMTRAGDTALFVGLLYLATQFGTLEIPALMEQASERWEIASWAPTLAALLLLGGALGKSAQLPLQTWLPDAMAGPTPVSALIHAATMVTAGVYLIARLHPLFLLAPAVLALVAWIGAATLLLAAGSALVQTDIKRVLAWSTVSQIGYMFLALGVGAFGAGMFHFFTHAFFKALLFLAAGAIIVALHHEQDIRRMGALRERLPWVFWTFLAGLVSLAALPWISAGFFSKELVLAAAWTRGGPLLWIAGWVGAVLTAWYAARLFLLACLGEPVTAVSRHPGWRIVVPLVVLAPFALGAGLFAHPVAKGLADIFPAMVPESSWVHWLGALAPLFGIVVAVYAWRTRPHLPPRAISAAFSGWGFDRLYRAGIERPIVSAARRVAHEPLDAPVQATERGMRALWSLMSAGQDGRLRRYATGIVSGAALVLALVWL